MRAACLPGQGGAPRQPLPRAAALPLFRCARNRNETETRFRYARSLPNLRQVFAKQKSLCVGRRRRRRHALRTECPTAKRARDRRQCSGALSITWDRKRERRGSLAPRRALALPTAGEKGHDELHVDSPSCSQAIARSWIAAPSDPHVVNEHTIRCKFDRRVGGMGSTNPTRTSPFRCTDGAPFSAHGMATPGRSLAA